MRALSLREWILTLDDEHSREKLKGLFPEGPNRRAPSPDGDEDGEGRETVRRGFALPSWTALGVMCLAGVAAAVAAFILIGRLESFSEYVRMGYGGQPFVGGGTLGTLRSLARSGPLEFLYSHRLLLSLLTGLAPFALGLRYHSAHGRLQTLSDELQSFAEGPWRAHQVEETQKNPGLPSEALLTGREVFEAIATFALACVLLYLVVDALGQLYGVLEALGAVSDSYGWVFEGSGRLTLVGALVAGLYVLVRRMALRRLKVRLVEGEIQP